MDAEVYRYISPHASAMAETVAERFLEPGDPAAVEEIYSAVVEAVVNTVSRLGVSVLVA